MVDQKCVRCGFEYSTTIENLANYCSMCGGRRFVLDAESEEESKTATMHGSTSTLYTGKIWRG